MNLTYDIIWLIDAVIGITLKLVLIVSTIIFVMKKYYLVK